MKINFKIISIVVLFCFNVSYSQNIEKHNNELSIVFGIGFGFRFTKNFNFRFEPKIHIWEMYYEDQFNKNDNLIKKYYTYTLGL